LPYYDIVFEGCNADEKTARKLGFEKIGVIPKDIMLLDLDRKKFGGEKRCIASGSAGNLSSAVSSGVAAVYLKEPIIDKSLIAKMADNSTILCISLSEITSLYGLKRSRTMLKVGRLFLYAKKKDVPVSFITAARSDSLMCSHMQMVELAKLLGADEEYARVSIGETNKMLLEI